MMNAAAKMEKKNIVNTTDKSTYSFDRSKSGNVVVNERYHNTGFTKQ